MLEKAKTLGPDKYTAVESLSTQPIPVSKLPPNILKYLEKEVQDPKAIEAAATTSYKDGTAMYLLEQKAAKSHDEKDSFTHRLYFVDATEDACIGYLEIRFDTIRDEAGADTLQVKGFPSVVYTRTEDHSDPKQNFQQRGFGTRRLIAANAYCIQHLGQPLHSGSVLRGHWARRTWERLVKAGAAEPTGDYYSHEYRFKNIA